MSRPVSPKERYLNGSSLRFPVQPSKAEGVLLQVLHGCKGVETKNQPDDDVFGWNRGTKNKWTKSIGTSTGKEESIYGPVRPEMLSIREKGREREAGYLDHAEKINVQQDQDFYSKMAKRNLKKEVKKEVAEILADNVLKTSPFRYGAHSIISSDIIRSSAANRSPSPLLSAANRSPSPLLSAANRSPSPLLSAANRSPSPVESSFAGNYNRDLIERGNNNRDLIERGNALLTQILRKVHDLEHVEQQLDPNTINQIMMHIQNLPSQQQQFLSAQQNLSSQQNLSDGARAIEEEMAALARLQEQYYEEKKLAKEEKKLARKKMKLKNEFTQSDGDIRNSGDLHEGGGDMRNGDMWNNNDMSPAFTGPHDGPVSSKAKDCWKIYSDYMRSNGMNPNFDELEPGEYEAQEYKLQELGKLAFGPPDDSGYGPVPHGYDPDPRNNNPDPRDNNPVITQNNNFVPINNNNFVPINNNNFVPINNNKSVPINNNNFVPINNNKFVPINSYKAKKCFQIYSDYMRSHGMNPDVNELAPGQYEAQEKKLQELASGPYPSGPSFNSSFNAAPLTAGLNMMSPFQVSSVDPNSPLNLNFVSPSFSGDFGGGGFTGGNGNGLSESFGNLNNRHSHNSAFGMSSHNSAFGMSNSTISLQSSNSNPDMRKVRLGSPKKEKKEGLYSKKDVHHSPHHRRFHHNKPRHLQRRAIRGPRHFADRQCHPYKRNVNEKTHGQKHYRNHEMNTQIPMTTSGIPMTTSGIPMTTVSGIPMAVSVPMTVSGLSNVPATPKTPTNVTNVPMTNVPVTVSGLLSNAAGPSLGTAEHKSTVNIPKRGANSSLIFGSAVVDMVHGDQNDQRKFDLETQTRNSPSRGNSRGIFSLQNGMDSTTSGIFSQKKEVSGGIFADSQNYSPTSQTSQSNSSGSPHSAGSPDSVGSPSFGQKSPSVQGQSSPSFVQSSPSVGSPSFAQKNQNSPSLLTTTFLSPSLADGGIFDSSPFPVGQFSPPSRRETPNFRMPSYAARMGPHGPGSIFGDEILYTSPSMAQNGANGVLNVNGEYYVNVGPSYVNGTGGYVNGTGGYGSVFSPPSPGADGMPVHMNMNPQYDARGYDSQSRIIQAPLLSAEHYSQFQNFPLGGSQLQNFQNFQNPGQNFQNANQAPLGHSPEQSSTRDHSPDILMGTYNGGYYGGRSFSPSVSPSRSPDRGSGSPDRRSNDMRSQSPSGPADMRSQSPELGNVRGHPDAIFAQEEMLLREALKKEGQETLKRAEMMERSRQTLEDAKSRQTLETVSEARADSENRSSRADSENRSSEIRQSAAEMAYPDETAIPHWENLVSQGDEIANANEDIDAVIGKMDDGSDAKKMTEPSAASNAKKMTKSGPMPLKEAPGPMQVAQPLPDNISYSPIPPATHENAFDTPENYYSDSQSLYHSSYGGQLSYGGDQIQCNGGETYNQGLRNQGFAPNQGLLASNQDPNMNDAWEENASFYSMGLSQGASQAAFGRAMTANSDEMNDMGYGINDMATINDMASFPDFSSLPDMSLPEAGAFLNEETAQETSQESGESVTQSQEEKRLHDFADETRKKKSAAAPTVSLTLHSPAKGPGTSSTTALKSTSRPLKPTQMQHQSSDLKHQSSDLKSDFRSVTGGTSSVKTGTESVKFANEVKSQELKKFQRRHSVTEMLDALSGQRSSSTLSGAQQRSSSAPADNRDPKGKKTLHHASSKGTLVYTSPSGKIFTTVLERASSPTDANRVAGARENSLSTKYGDARSRLANAWRNEQLNKNRRRRGSLMENLVPSQAVGKTFLSRSSFCLTPLDPNALNLFQTSHGGQEDGDVVSSNRSRSRSSRAAHRQLKKETKREEKELRREEKRLAKEKKKSDRSNSKDRVNSKDSHVSQKSEKSSGKSSGQLESSDDVDTDDSEDDNESKEITTDSNEEDDEFDLNSISLTGNAAELASALSTKHNLTWNQSIAATLNSGRDWNESMAQRAFDSNMLVVLKPNTQKREIQRDGKIKQRAFCSRVAVGKDSTIIGKNYSSMVKGEVFATDISNQTCTKSFVLAASTKLQQKKNRNLLIREGGYVSMKLRNKEKLEYELRNKEKGINLNQEGTAKKVKVKDLEEKMLMQINKVREQGWASAQRIESVSGKKDLTAHFAGKTMATESQIMNVRQANLNQNAGSVQANAGSNQNNKISRHPHLYKKPEMHTFEGRLRASQMINKFIGNKINSSSAVAPILGMEKKAVRWNDLMAKTRPALAVRPVKQKSQEKLEYPCNMLMYL